MLALLRANGLEAKSKLGQNFLIDLNLMDIVRGQGHLLWGWLPAWGIITQPLAFILFVTAGIAVLA